MRLGCWGHVIDSNQCNTLARPENQTFQVCPFPSSLLARHMMSLKPVHRVPIKSIQPTLKSWVPQVAFICFRCCGGIFMKKLGATLTPLDSLSHWVSLEFFSPVRHLRNYRFLLSLSKFIYRLARSQETCWFLVFFEENSRKLGIVLIKKRVRTHLRIFRRWWIPAKECWRSEWPQLAKLHEISVCPSCVYGYC